MNVTEMRFIPIKSFIYFHVYISDKCIRTQSDCNRFGNGDFQTCGDCRYFATCSEGIVYIRPCPNNLVFDSNTRTCQFNSATCHSHTPFG